MFPPYHIISACSTGSLLRYAILLLFSLSLSRHGHLLTTTCAPTYTHTPTTHMALMTANPMTYRGPSALGNR